MSGPPPGMAMSSMGGGGGSAAGSNPFGCLPVGDRQEGLLGLVAPCGAPDIFNAKIGGAMSALMDSKILGVLEAPMTEGLDMGMGSVFEEIINGFKRAVTTGTGADMQGQAASYGEPLRPNAAMAAMSGSEGMSF